MKIILLAAIARNGVIGKDGHLPWHLPPDMARFRRLTMGHPLIMGRKTWDSIGGPLDGRLNIVLSRNPEFEASGALTARSIVAAFRMAAETGTTKVFVIGGGEVFGETMDLADILELTIVEREFSGEVLFPKVHREEWTETFREDHVASHSSLPFRYVRLERSH